MLAKSWALGRCELRLYSLDLWMLDKSGIRVVLADPNDDLPQAGRILGAQLSCFGEPGHLFAIGNPAEMIDCFSNTLRKISVYVKAQSSEFFVIDIIRELIHDG